VAPLEFNPIYLGGAKVYFAGQYVGIVQDVRVESEFEKEFKCINPMIIDMPCTVINSFPLFPLVLCSKETGIVLYGN